MHRALISLLSCLLVASSARAQVIEQVVATLDDEPIYASELMARLGDQEPDRRAYRALLERMIEERLIAREARRLSVVVHDEEVQRGLDSVRAQSGLVDEEALFVAIEDQGYTRERYLAELRGQLLRMRLVQLLAGDALDVDEAALRRRYDERVEAAGSRMVYRGRAVHFLIRDDADRAAREARAVLAELRAGRVSVERAIDDEAGGPFGPISEDELVPEVSRALAGLSVGETSEVVGGDGAFHILVLEARSPGGLGTFDELRDEMRTELINLRMERAEARMVRQLRRRALVILRI